MATKTIIRGDDYNLREPYRRYALFNPNGSAKNLANCTVMTTHKPEKTLIEEDPYDLNALRHHIIISGAGAITSSSGLKFETNAAAGVLIETMSAAETSSLPVDVPLYSDLQLIDENGETVTYIMVDTTIAIDAYTNRVSVA